MIFKNERKETVYEACTDLRGCKEYGFLARHNQNVLATEAINVES